MSETETLLGELPQAARPGLGWRYLLLLPATAFLGLAFTPHERSLRGVGEVDARQLSLTLFEGVDGAVGRACRGSSPSDNNPAYFEVVNAPDLASCQLLCLESNGCQGVEFHLTNGRCELWQRPIEATSPFVAECYRRVGMFEPVDGGVDRACRGASEGDNNPIHYELRVSNTFADCQRECLRTAACRGIEYSPGRCELWTRLEGIQASTVLSGFQCYRAVSSASSTTGTTSTTGTVTTVTSMTSSATTSATSLTVTATTTLVTSVSQAAVRTVGFRAVDGGVDRVCRGADEFDNNPSYFGVYDVDDLEACKDLCVANTSCVGVENIGRRCELWTRPCGIEASRALADYVCLEAVTFSPVDGAAGRACRRNSVGDNSPAYYTVFTESSLEACQTRCVNSPNCTGVEFSGSRCEVWNQTILASAAVSGGFQCFRYGSRVRSKFLMDVENSDWEINGGLDMECVGAGAQDDSPSYYSLVQASSLQRCQARCLELTICIGIEYAPDRCQLWTRPAGLTSRPMANSVCLTRPSSSPPGNLKTKYVVHYMPWFVGFNNGLYDHWCTGNHHYESYLGQYVLTTRSIVQEQLDLMQANSIDGLWIDYQLTSWDAAIDIVMEETAIRGMGVAIVIDSATDPDIFLKALPKMIEWTALPHYYRVNGIPVVPLFQTPDINFQAFPFEAYYIPRRGGPLPAWANGSYPWVTPSLDALDSYYQEDHSLASFAVGAAYRGFRDCYDDRTLITPFLEMLDPTLKLASKFQPEFVQVITWNDYSEGTMIEPSWVRPRDTCLSACETIRQPCLTTAACDSGFDPLDCSKPYGSFEGPVDPQCNLNKTARADDDLRLLRDHIDAEAAGTLQLEYHAGMFHQTVVESANWYRRAVEYDAPAAPELLDDVMVKK